MRTSSRDCLLYQKRWHYALQNAVACSSSHATLWLSGELRTTNINGIYAQVSHFSHHLAACLNSGLPALDSKARAYCARHSVQDTEPLSHGKATSICPYSKKQSAALLAFPCVSQIWMKSELDVRPRQSNEVC